MLWMPPELELELRVCSDWMAERHRNPAAPAQSKDSLGLIFIECAGDQAAACAALAAVRTLTGRDEFLVIALFAQEDQEAMTDAIEAGFEDAFTREEGERAFRRKCLAWRRAVLRRRQFGRSVRLGEQQLGMLLEKSSISLYAFDRDLRFTWVHNQHASLRVDDLLGRRSEELPGVEDVAEFTALKTEVLATGRRIQRRVRSRSRGRDLYHDAVAEPLRDDQGAIVGGIVAATEITEHIETRRRLEEVEAQFRLIEDLSPDMIWMFRSPTELEYTSPSWTRYTGLGLADLVPDAWRSFVHPDDLPGLLAAWTESWGKGLPFRYELRKKGLDGAYRWFWARSFPEFDDDGHVVRLIGVTSDIDERKRAEIALRVHAEKLDQLVHANPIGMMLASLDGRIVEANDTMLRLIGRSRDALETGALRWDEITPPEWRTGDESAVRAVLDRGYCTPYEKEYMHADGRRIPILIGYAAPRIPDALATVFVLDLSEQRAAQAAVRESESRFQDLANSISQFAWMADESGSILWYNQRWYDYTGTDFESMQGWGWQAVHHPEHVERVSRRFREHVAAGESWEDTFPLRARDGGYRWFLSRAVPIRDDAGRIVRWFGTNTDVTDLREAREHAERLQAQFEAVLQAVQDGIIVGDSEGDILFVNQAEARLSGFADPEDMKRSLAFFATCFEMRDPRGSLVSLEERPLARVLRGETLRDHLLRVRRVDDGQELFISYSGQPVFGAQGKVLLGVLVLRDVTVQMHAEEELRRRHEKFRALAESMPQIVWTAQPDGAVDYYNQRWAEYSGIPVEGGHDWGWAPVVHPDDEDATMAAWKGAVESGTVYVCEHRIRRRDGEFRWHLSRGVPLKDEQGRVLKWFGTATNIDDQKRAEDELRQAHRELRQAHRDLRRAHEELRLANETLEERVRSRTSELERQRQELQASNAELRQFAYVASHDLQEPLRTVTSCTQYLHRRIGRTLDPETQEFMGYIVEGSQRMYHLIQGLLSYAQVGREREAIVETFAEEALAAALQNLAADVAAAQAEVQHAPLPTIRIPATQLVQLFQNLVGNAIKFRKAGAAPVVRIQARRTGADWTFSVHDNGIGIDPEYRERIFQIFQRLHGREEYPGSGIGLAICKKIVEGHGGRIWVESTPGNGAEFLFTLPAIPDADDITCAGDSASSPSTPRSSLLAF